MYEYRCKIVRVIDGDIVEAKTTPDKLAEALS